MQPTAASPLLTDPGSAVGTVAYMSPEQLRGEDVDARTDLFSFGLVLYEMATGRPAFGGATSAAVAAAILHQEPSAPREVRAELPERLETVILKAIEKDRDLRFLALWKDADPTSRLSRKRRQNTPGCSSLRIQLYVHPSPENRGRKRPSGWAKSVTPKRAAAKADLLDRQFSLTICTQIEDARERSLL